MNEKKRILVLGGGFAGVETIAAIHDFMHQALPHYPSLAVTDVRMVLVHPGGAAPAEPYSRLGLQRFVSDLDARIAFTRSCGTSDGAGSEFCCAPFPSSTVLR